MNAKNQTQKQFFRSRATTGGNAYRLQFHLCALLLAAAAVAALAPAATGNEKPNAAADAPNTSVGDSSQADAGLTSLRYTTCTNFTELLQVRDARYATLTRVSDPGTKEHPMYNGFFFYQALQFDATDRYMLGMRVYFDFRPILPTDRADIGYIDLEDGNKWTKIGESTAWNWQQGNRLQWRPASDEIAWNDRSDDGKSLVCRLYDFRSGKRRTLPRPIYAFSPDGSLGLTDDFSHAGLGYGAGDKDKGQRALSKTGVWKVNVDTGQAELLLPVDKAAAISRPKGATFEPGSVFPDCEEWNPSGTRIFASIDYSGGLPEGADKILAYSIATDGTDLRYLYPAATHHGWLDDNYIFDFGCYTPPGGGPARNGYFLFKDDGSGAAKELLWPIEPNPDLVYDGNGHGSVVPGTSGDWILSDTYQTRSAFVYVFMFHRPSKLFVPLAKLKCERRRMDIGDAKVVNGLSGVYRVDAHPRFSRNGRKVSIDAVHEGLGRQIYVMDIGYILDNPPTGRTLAQ